MGTKYQLFENAIVDLKSESIKCDCELLIYLAQVYYSHYKQYKSLEKVKRKLAYIYEVPSEQNKFGIKEIKPRKGQLDIRVRLFIEFYRKLIIKWLEKRGRDSDNIPEKEIKVFFMRYKGEIPCMIEDFRLEDVTIGKKTLKEYLLASCGKAKKIYEKKGKIILGMDNIREAIELFDRCKKLTLESKEESFDRVFSEAYVNLLVNVMEKEEKLLSLWIAPIRSQLSEKERGGSEKDNLAWKWCFEKDYRLSISELETEIQYMKEYDKIFKQFQYASKKLDEIELSILE